MTGHKETTMTVATEERGGGTLVRRMILVLAAAALMAAMMALSAMPAVAESLKGTGGGKPIASGQIFEPRHNGGIVFHKPTCTQTFVHGNAGPNGGDGQGGNCA
jgi:hypothetical protein